VICIGYRRALRPTARLIISSGWVGRAASRIKRGVGRISRRFIAFAMTVAATQASADGLVAAQPKSNPPHAAKSKTVRPPRSQGPGLADIPFSNPYAPPVGAGKSTGAEFPAAGSAAPVDPKGDLSLTYKWKANNDPVDPFWNIRSAPGSEAPGESFMGGLRLGF
jgi:hypothetical protein